MAPKATSSKATIVKLEAIGPSSSQRRLDPLTAFKAPWSSLKNDENTLSQNLGGNKGKAKEYTHMDTRTQDDRMWVDIYEPTTEVELAVHKRKVQDVRTWLEEAFGGGPSGKLAKYRRVLTLTGPAGTAKTATIRVLAREMGFEILEWRSAIDDLSGARFEDEPFVSNGYSSDAESLFTKFEAFLNRASNYQDIFMTMETKTLSQSQPSPSKYLKRHIILLEDLPNILHPGIQARFHTALQSLIASPISSPPVPIVVVISDTVTRGEESDERLASGRWSTLKDGIIDIRTVFPRDLLHGPYLSQISFNPIAPTLLTRALQALLSTRHSSTSEPSPSKEVLNAIVETSNGDIRSAIMALQFACTTKLSSRGRGGRHGKNHGLSKSVVLESVTRREQSLVVFHLMGRVLYNKRKGDPPQASSTAKDIQREKAIDKQLRDPPKLPPDLLMHERKASRVDVNTLYSESPIDSSLFSLYIHQNYPQFCDSVESCEGIADWLSWVDCSGGEAWYQANPYRFHLLTLGTLHSLPSPVTRRSQKVLKPVFFDQLQKEKNAWDGLRDVQGWVLGQGTVSTGNWSTTAIAVELGGVLKAYDASPSAFGTTTTKTVQRWPPPTHRLFSRMQFIYMGPSAPGDAQVLDEREANNFGTGREEDEEDFRHASAREVKVSSTWLEDDDIEEF